jgi:hypothetical protein
MVRLAWLYSGHKDALQIKEGKVKVKLIVILRYIKANKNIPSLCQIKP